MDNLTNPKCGRCNCFWKPDETDIKTSGLIYKTCKRCRGKLIQYNKKYYQENADKLKQQTQKYKQENADKIIKHRQENTDRNKERCKKWKKDNKDKVSEYNKKYRQENKDEIKEREIKYKQENPDKIKQTSKKYYQTHKCEHNKNTGKCIICNLSLYLINIQRGQIWRCLKLSTQNKTKSSIEYLGCDADYFKDYIQKKMDIYNQTAEVKMDFTNIHIDHIKPISVFNLDDEEEFLDCCNYTNLQPLLSKDNLIKKNKWTDEDDVFWNDNIKGKEYLQIYNL